MINILILRQLMQAHLKIRCRTADTQPHQNQNHDSRDIVLLSQTSICIRIFSVFKRRLQERHRRGEVMATAIAEFIKEPYPGQARKKLSSGCLAVTALVEPGDLVEPVALASPFPAHTVSELCP